MEDEDGEGGAAREEREDSFISHSTTVTNIQLLVTNIVLKKYFTKMV